MVQWEDRLCSGSTIFTPQMCLNFTVSSWAVETSWPHPVELGPGYGHVTVILWVIAAVSKSLLCQEDQVILWQATPAVHLRLVLHIEGLAQLGPQHLVWHDEGHPALSRRERVENTGGKAGQWRRSDPDSCQFICSIVSYHILHCHFDKIWGNYTEWHKGGTTGQNKATDYNFTKTK